MGQAAIRLKAGRARWAGLQTCKSVWHCPCCAGIIAEGRREQLNGTMGREIAQGAELWMVALTLPHTRFQTCKELRDAVASSWSRLIAGAPWKRAAGKAGLRGWVRALEVTHGING